MNVFNGLYNKTTSLTINIHKLAKTKVLKYMTLRALGESLRKEKYEEGEPTWRPFRKPELT